MPSSQKALKDKVADLEARVAELTAEAFMLRMQCEAQDQVIALQNGAMDEMGKLIDRMPGGLVAALKVILRRHGVVFQPEKQPLQ